MNVEVAQNTAIFCRVDKINQMFIKPHEFRGYGFEFEKAYTTCQISGSTGHHRIISYRFADLNFIVRHETDGYVDAGTGIPSSSKEPKKGILSRVLESLSLSPTSSPLSTAPTGTKLTIKHEGQVIPLESTLEIKTRKIKMRKIKTPNFHHPLDIGDVTPQLWVSRTPKLVRAYHKNGAFRTPELEDVAARIQRWEERNQKTLSKLAGLIKRILIVVREYGGSAMVGYDAEGDKLVIWKVDGKKMLPLDLYSRWDNNCIPGADTNMKHDAGAESAEKPLDGAKTEAEEKGILSGLEDAKGKKPSEVAEEDEQAWPDNKLSNPTPAKDTCLRS